MTPVPTVWQHLLHVYEDDQEEESSTQPIQCQFCDEPNL